MGYQCGYMYLTNSMFEDTEIRTKKTHINWHFVRKLKYTHFNFLKNLHIYVYIQIKEDKTQLINVDDDQSTKHSEFRGSKMYRCCLFSN